MNLKSFLADIGMTRNEFAELIECHPNYLSRIMSGKAPGKRLLRDIEKYTEGKVVFSVHNQKQQNDCR